MEFYKIKLDVFFGYIAGGYNDQHTQTICHQEN